jgi:uncharacterized protein (TIGR02118 family)
LSAELLTGVKQNALINKTPEHSRQFGKVTEMAVSVQVLYPVGDDTTFDYNYYSTKHMDIVSSCMGPHIDTVVVTKGIAGGPDTPPAYHAIATIVCKDQTALDAMLAASDPAMADIPNFTNVQPQLLIGEVIG